MENYSGFESIFGVELIEKMKTQQLKHRTSQNGKI